MMANPRRVAVGLGKTVWQSCWRCCTVTVGCKWPIRMYLLTWSAEGDGNQRRLALLLAMVSQPARTGPLPQDPVVFGEVGLAGEIRPVPSGQNVSREAAKHGFRRAIVPAANVPKSAGRDADFWR